MAISSLCFSDIAENSQLVNLVTRVSPLMCKAVNSPINDIVNVNVSILFFMG